MAQPTFTSKPPFLQRGRKAVTAGALAAFGAFVTSFLAETPKTRDGWIALVCGAVAIGIGAGWSTFKVRNTGKGMVEGSDPLPVTPRTPPPPPAAARGSY